MICEVVPRPNSSGRSSVAPVATITTADSSTSVRLPLALAYDAAEVADEALEVGYLGLQMDVHVRIVDQTLLELFDELRRPGAADRPVDGQGGAAERSLAFDQVDRVPHLGQRQRRRHACHAAADDQRRVGERDVDLVERLEQLGTGDGHADEVPGLGRRLLWLVAVHQGALVADVGHLEQVRVQSGLSERVLEDRLVGARRAACHTPPG